MSAAEQLAESVRALVAEAIAAATPPSMPAKRLFSIREAAAYLGMSVRTIHEMLANRELSAVRTKGGGRTLLDVQDLDRWIDAQKQA